MRRNCTNSSTGQSIVKSALCYSLAGMRESTNRILSVSDGDDEWSQEEYVIVHAPLVADNETLWSSGL